MDRPHSSGAAEAAAATRCLADTAASFQALTEAGDWVHVHAGPDPRAEAWQMLSVVASPSPPVVVIIAAGLGYLTEAAAARWPDARLVVVEPDAAVAAAAQRRFAGIYSAARLRLLVGPDYAGADDLWRVFDRSERAMEGPPVLADPVLARAWPTRLRDAARLVGRAVAGARMNAEARAQNAGRYLVNTLRNVRHVARGPNPAALAGGFAGVPAVVVGAGPSLTSTMPVLRDLADRALLIATDTAWRPLVAAGLHPHFVVAVDPTPENGRHLQQVCGSPDTWIIAEASVDPPSLRPHAGRVATFRVAAHQPWPWLVEHGGEALTLRAWGSVLTSAFDLALACGCAPVVFVGADLAFTDGRPYCRGTTVEDEWARHTARGVSLRTVWGNTLASRPLVSLPSVTGEAVPTAPHLIEFRDWILARAAEAVPGRVVNASGTGILHGPSVTVASLADVLATRPPCAASVQAAIRTALETPHGPARADGLADALRAIGRGQDDTHPIVASWVAAGSPSLTSEAIRAAALEGAEYIAAPLPAPRQAPPRPAARWFAADRVAAARARLTGETGGLEGLDPPPPRATAAAVAAARQVSTALLALPEIATGPGDDVAAGAAPDTVPLSQRFRWSEAARPLVEALEEALLDVAPDRRDDDQSAPHDWRAAVPSRDVSDAGSDHGEDAAARAAVAGVYLAVERWATADRTGREARLLAVAERALSVPALLANRAHGLDLHLRDGVLRLPLVDDALVRAVTGTVVEVRDDRAPASAFLQDMVCEIAPEILTDGGTPRGWSLVTLSDTTALFVPAGTTGSLAIGAEGPPAPASTWPGPITGEMPWGADGGRLAWNARTRDIYWRVSTGASVAHARTPFTPGHVARMSNDALIWTGADGRLWRWRPGDDARLLAALPDAGIPRGDGAALVVAPMPRDTSGRVRRVRSVWEYRVDPHTGDVSRQPCWVEGQCAKVASSPDGTAATHPCADLVRITIAGGRAYWLACETPVGVAWAGASLLVTLASGELLRFPHLRSRLTGRLDGASLAI